ncbi:FtsX-like permease family protein [Stackebrandtia endophytica]|uniref:FtsX-like permease family protein n=1 Tax=Stackebrandtia endophytica TaxID=1496996 RepID=A0A543AZW7_9ACTN|nr:FtsX-like permease family protein [Stackebrandtia endophytica]TQL78127.1 FtsX-like permease family protein [Stackebrandtia endophytica]
MARGLTSQLIAVGRSVQPRGEARRLRTVALVLAYFLLAVSGLTAVAVHEAYAGKAARAADRAPVVDNAAADPGVRWLPGADELTGSRQYAVFYIEPSGSEAPLPPGVAAWPGPGEVLMSPALLEAGAGEGISQRFGEVVGTIGLDGLADPGEWLAYVHPSQGVHNEGAAFVVDFGGVGQAAETAGGFMFSQHDRPEWTLHVLNVLAVLLPGTILLVIGSRIGAHHRDRRVMLLTVLGAGRWDRLRVVIGEMLVPSAIGVVAAMGVSAWLLSHQVRLPGVDYVLSAEDMRGAVWPLILAPVGVVAAAIFIAALLSFRASAALNSTRPIPKEKRDSMRLWAALCPVMVLIAVWGPGRFPDTSVWFTLASWIGTAGVVVTLPAAIAMFLAWVGKWIAHNGRAGGRAGQLVAGRLLSAHPRPMARMVAAVATAILLLLQVVAWQGIFGHQARQASTVVEQTGPGMVVFDPSSHIRPDDADGLLRRLPTGVSVFTLSAERGGDGSAKVQLTGTCDDLPTIGINCPTDSASQAPTTPDSRLDVALAWTFGPALDVDIVPGPVLGDSLTGENDPILLLVDRDDAAIDIPALKELSYRTTGHIAQIQIPGTAWLTGGIPNLEQARWSTLYGAIAITVLLIAAGLSATAEHHRRGRALALLSALTDNHRTNLTTATWLVGVPLTVTGIVATLLGTWIAQPINTIGASLITPTLITGCLVTTTVIAVAMSTWAVILSNHHQRRWTPDGS